MRKDKAVRKAELKAAFIEKLKSLISPLIILAIIVAAVLVIMYWPETVVEEKKPITNVNINVEDVKVDDSVITDDQFFDDFFGDD